MADDMELVRRYAQGKSEEAFAAIVSRHVNLVYSVALRKVGEPQLAEEITQTVFIILARKAGALSSGTILAGWLCRTARYASAKALLREQRRVKREHHAYMQSHLNEPEAQDWRQIEPLLEEAMSQLGEREHDALVLRFFEGRSYQAVSETLRTSEAAAKMRVNRGLEKLRKIFKKRGLTLSAAMIAGAVSGYSVQAAPTGLAAGITSAALHGTTVTTSTLTLIKTTMKLMAWTKFKSAAALGLITIIAGATATLVVTAVASEGAKSAARSEGFTFAGYASPEAAFQSFLYGLSTGDLDKTVAACTPEQAKRMRKNAEGKSVEEIRKLLTGWAGTMKGFRLSQKEPIGADEARLHLMVQPYPGHPHIGNDVQVMRKTQGEWKYDGKYGVDIKVP